jgi:hypothetical protein
MRARDGGDGSHPFILEHLRHNFMARIGNRCLGETAILARLKEAGMGFKRGPVGTIQSREQLVDDATSVFGGHVAPPLA